MEWSWRWWQPGYVMMWRVWKPSQALGLTSLSCCPQALPPKWEVRGEMDLTASLSFLPPPSTQVRQFYVSIQPPVGELMTPVFMSENEFKKEQGECALGGRGGAQRHLLGLSAPAHSHVGDPRFIRQGGRTTGAPQELCRGQDTSARLWREWALGQAGNSRPALQLGEHRGCRKFPERVALRGHSTGEW